MARPPLKERERCPKCSTGAQNARAWLTDSEGEFLRFRCWACKYDWETLTADHAALPPRKVTVEVLEVTPVPPATPEPPVFWLRRLLGGG